MRILSDMENRLIMIVGGGLGLACSVQAQVQGYQDSPQLPGVPYVVHDGTRPQPPAVDPAGAVEVKPPSDAKILFDGSSLDAWTTDGGEAGWDIKDGVLVAKDKDLHSKESFGSVQLHIEWRIPAGRKVEGQGGGNSGVFLMDLYEVQMLQSHANPTYPDGQAGAIYGQLPPLRCRRASGRATTSPSSLRSMRMGS